MKRSDGFTPAEDDLLRAAGLRAPFERRPLPGGRNNRVERIVDANDQEVLLKTYFRDPDDPRDRLAAEYGFLDAAARLQIAAVARPLGVDAAHGLALFTLLPGRSMMSDDITEASLGQALAFIQALNPRDRAPLLSALGAASEACFTPQAHLAIVDRRLARLDDALAKPATDTDAQAARFVQHELAPAWEKARRQALEAFDRLRLDPEAPLPIQAQCLSPSDFGFHNAVIDAAGTVRFVDFEYAGWDDPAKLVCDAFNQPRLPWPRSFYPTFRDAIAGWRENAASEAARYDALLPVHAIKWAAIMLNEFLPVGARRRAFAGEPSPERRSLQLAAAKRKLQAARFDGVPVRP